MHFPKCDGTHEFHMILVLVVQVYPPVQRSHIGIIISQSLATVVRVFTTMFVYVFIYIIRLC